MPFIVTWDEVNPTNATPGVNIDDEFRNLKASVAERLVGCFTDWRTAVDRIHLEKLFVHSANGLTLRDANDTTDLWKISAAGAVTENGRPMCFVSRVTNHAAGGALTAVTFTSELLDQGNCFDLAGQPTRLVAPSAGKYLFFAYIRYTLPSDTVGNQYINVDWRKNGATSTMTYLNQLLDLGNTAVGATIAGSEFRPWIENLNASDYMELRIHTATGTVPAVFAGMLKLA